MKKNKLKILNYKFYSILILVIAIFCLGILHGHYIGNNFKFQIIDYLIKYIGNVVGSAKGFNLFFTIFFNNFKVSLMLFFSGFTIFLPFLILYTNGLSFGVLDFAVTRAFSVFNIPTNNFIIKGTIIHGIPELSAVFLSATFGIYIGFSLFGFIFKYLQFNLFDNFNKKNFVSISNYNKSKKRFQLILKRVSYLFVITIIPLLLFAAILETFVTPKYIEYSMVDSIGTHNNFYHNFDYFSFLDNCSHNQNLSKLNIDTQKLLSNVVLGDYYDNVDALLSKNNLESAEIAHNSNNYIIAIPFGQFNNLSLFIDNMSLKSNYDNHDCFVLFNDVYECGNISKNIKTIICSKH